MKLQTAKGVKDITREEKSRKNSIVETLKEVFTLYGFAPLETPLIERYETLAAKFAAGGVSDALKEIFTLKDQGGRKLGLRFDLTVPLARFIATNPTLKLPFKRYEIGSVFRDGPIKTGRMRQFWQCDVDTVGSSSLLADAEIISVAQTAFNKLKLDVMIKVNNRKILNGVLTQAKIEKKEEAIIALDKLDKIGKDGVSKELKEKGYSTKQVNSLFSLVDENITLAQLKSKLRDEEGLQGIQELEELFSYLRQMGVKKAKFDVSLARGLAYYTGTVFEVFSKDGKITSSLAAGGRWDAMIGKFAGGGRKIPAVGISFGIVPIMETLNKTELKDMGTAKVYILPINTTSKALTLIQQLREAGITADFSLGKKGVTKNLQYANAMGIPYVLILGEKEVAKNKFLLRDMDSGKESLLSLQTVIKRLK